MGNQRGVEVYSNQFATWCDRYFVANNNLNVNDEGFCNGKHLTMVKVGIVANYYIAEAMDSSNDNGLWGCG